MEPGTRVRVTKGPLGLVDGLGARRFIERVAMVGDTGTLTEWATGVDGYVYVEMDEPLPDGQPVYLPVPPAWIEAIS